MNVRMLTGTNVYVIDQDEYLCDSLNKIRVLTGTNVYVIDQDEYLYDSLNEIRVIDQDEYLCDGLNEIRVIDQDEYLCDSLNEIRVLTGTNVCETVIANITCDLFVYYLLFIGRVAEWQTLGT